MWNAVDEVRRVPERNRSRALPVPRDPCTMELPASVRMDAKDAPQAAGRVVCCVQCSLLVGPWPGLPAARSAMRAHSDQGPLIGLHPCYSPVYSVTIRRKRLTEHVRIDRSCEKPILRNRVEQRSTLTAKARRRTRKFIVRTQARELASVLTEFVVYAVLQSASGTCKW